MDHDSGTTLTYTQSGSHDYKTYTEVFTQKLAGNNDPLTHEQFGHHGFLQKQTGISPVNGP